MGNTKIGKNYSVAMGVYVIVKAVLNIILGDGITALVLPILIAIVLFVGIKYGNYAVAVILGVTVLMHIGTNISNLGFNRYLIYFIEGLIDIFCVVMLCVQKDVKAFFDTPSNDGNV
jgi:hypothetical protein